MGRFGEISHQIRAQRLEVVNPLIPPKSPEFNPVKNTWQFIRDNWLRNRVFTSYQDILDHCCYAWNSLIEQPWIIVSIGLRKWAHQ